MAGIKSLKVEKRRNQEVVVNDFDNGLAFGIHYSRFISSWLDSYIRFWRNSSLPIEEKVKKLNRNLIFGKDFIDWLHSLDLTEAEIRRIRLLAVNGKMELEANANAFLNNI